MTGWSSNQARALAAMLSGDLASALALAQARALEILRGVNGAVDWSYVSPPPIQLVEGEATGRYRVRAGDLPITDEQGESRITVPDYAAAIIDALEGGTFVGERFTAAY